MKCEITVTVNLGNYENVKLLVEGNTFEECDMAIKNHIDKRQLALSRGLSAYFKDVK